MGSRELKVMSSKWGSKIKPEKQNFYCGRVLVNGNESQKSKSSTVLPGTCPWIYAQVKAQVKCLGMHFTTAIMTSRKSIALIICH